MARKDDLAAMLANKDDTELQRIIEQVEELKRKRAEEQSKEVIDTIEKRCAELKELAATIGMNFKYNLVTPRSAGRGSSAASGARSRVAPKYRNPKDSNQTWSGRGIKPKWLRAEIEKGRKIEEFLI